MPVAHCPRSNALLGCGIAPLAELRAAGVTVGLGTDSPASVPSFDMFEELRTAIVVARARERRTDALLAEDALRLATLDAARALRLDAQVGTLEPGKRADLVVVSLAGSPYHPVEDPAAAVVFGGSPERVLETIVDGRTRYRSEERGPSGKRHTAPQAPPARECSQRGRSRVAGDDRAQAEAEAAAVAGRALLLAPAGACQMGVRRCSPLAFGLGFVIFGVGSGSTGISDALQNAFNFGSSGTSISSLEKKVAKHPENAGGLAEPRHGLRDEAAHPGRDQRARAVHRAEAEER